MQKKGRTDWQGLGARQGREAEMPEAFQDPLQCGRQCLRKRAALQLFENIRLQGWLLERALQLLEGLQLQELLLDVITDAVVISACRKSRMAERALQLSEEISKDPSRM